MSELQVQVFMQTQPSSHNLYFVHTCKFRDCVNQRQACLRKFEKFYLSFFEIENSVIDQDSWFSLSSFPVYLEIVDCVQSVFYDQACDAKKKKRENNANREEQTNFPSITFGINLTFSRAKDSSSKDRLLQQFHMHVCHLYSSKNYYWEII